MPGRDHTTYAEEAGKFAGLFCFVRQGGWQSLEIFNIICIL